MIAAIAAVDGAYGIGYNGQLLESIPADLKFFKETTLNSTVIMGRKTYDSLPKKPLPNRRNIVITSTPGNDKDVTYMNLEEVKSFLETSITSERIFIIGGGTIYKELLPYCTELFLTRIFKLHENVDTYFPIVEALNEWKRDDNNIVVLSYKDINYQFQHYSRI